MEPKQTFDYIVVLGSALYGKKGRIPKVLKNRLDKAIKLYDKGAAPKIIVSGGSTGDLKVHTEADKMAEYLKSNGVKESDIIKENESISTIGNAFFTKQLLRGLHAVQSSLLVVTSDIHIIRTEFIFNKVFDGKAELTFEAANTPLKKMRKGFLEENVKFRKAFAKLNVPPGTDMDLHVERLLRDGKLAYEKKRRTITA